MRTKMMTITTRAEKKKKKKRKEINGVQHERQIWIEQPGLSRSTSSRCC